MRGIARNTAIAALALAAPVGAEEGGPVLPERPPASRYQAQWNQSAFNREVVKPVTVEIQSDFAKSLVLEGIVNDGKNGPQAFLRNTAPAEDEYPFFFITKEKTDRSPYYIEEAHLASNPTESTVKITDGNESAVLSYDASIITSRVEQPPPAPGAQQAKDAQKAAAAAARQAAREQPSSTSQAGEDPSPSGNRPPAQGAEAQSPQADDDDDPAERILNRARRRVIPPPSED